MIEVSTLFDLAAGLFSLVRRRKQSPPLPTSPDLVIREVDPNDEMFAENWKAVEKLYERIPRVDRIDSRELSYWLLRHYRQPWNIFLARQRVLLAVDANNNPVGTLMYVYYPVVRKALVQYIIIARGLQALHGRVSPRLLAHMLRDLARRPFGCTHVLMEVEPPEVGIAARARLKVFDQLASRYIQLHTIGNYNVPSLNGGSPYEVMLVFGELSNDPHIRTTIRKKQMTKLVSFLYNVAYADSFDRFLDRREQFRLDCRTLCRRALQSIPQAQLLPIKPLEDVYVRKTNIA